MWQVMLADLTCAWATFVTEPTHACKKDECGNGYSTIGQKCIDGTRFVPRLEKLITLALSADVSTIRFMTCCSTVGSLSSTTT